MHLLYTTGGSVYLHSLLTFLNDGLILKTVRENHEPTKGKRKRLLCLIELGRLETRLGGRDEFDATSNQLAHDWMDGIFFPTCSNPLKQEIFQLFLNIENQKEHYMSSST